MISLDLGINEAERFSVLVLLQRLEAFRTNHTVMEGIVPRGIAYKGQFMVVS